MSTGAGRPAPAQCVAASGAAVDPRAYRRPVAARWRGVGEAALLTLVGGLFVLCGLAVVFAKLLDSVLEGDGIALVDRPISGWLAAHREHWLTLAMRAIT